VWSNKSSCQSNTRLIIVATYARQYGLHLQDRHISWGRNQRESMWQSELRLVSSGFPYLHKRPFLSRAGSLCSLREPMAIDGLSYSSIVLHVQTRILHKRITLLTKFFILVSFFACSSLKMDIILFSQNVSWLSTDHMASYPKR
jgi:hypothetical protein